MNKLNLYYCFSEEGERNLPSLDEISQTIQSGIEPIIFIDSCVCLHIIKVVDYGKKATNVDLKEILSFKNYLENNPVTLSPFFGLIELCLKDGHFDKQKFSDFKNRIDFFRQIPFKDFKKFKYNYSRDFHIFKTITENLHNPYQAIEPSLMNSYCTLLKIRSIALKGLQKQNAESNIDSLFNWMINVLDCMRAVEYKLALNIFGGNTTFRKMIALDSKSSNVKKILIGTSWDIYHSKNTTNSFRLFQILGDNILPYFVTSDSNLFGLFKKYNLALIKDGGKDLNSSFIINSEFDFPHLSNDIIDKQNKKMMDYFIERRNNNSKYDKQKMDKLIENLERENDL